MFAQSDLPQPFAGGRFKTVARAALYQYLVTLNRNRNWRRNGQRYWIPLSFGDQAKLIPFQRYKLLFKFVFRHALLNVKNKRNKKSKQKESGTNRVKDTTELVKKDTDKEKKEARNEQPEKIRQA